MDQETKDFIKGEIEGLAQMVAKGFEAVESRFDRVESRLAAAEEETRQSTKVLLKLENGLRERVLFQDDEMRTLSDRVERVEDQLGLPHTLVA